ncbi:MAG: hypothetical protein DRP66_06120 [Planctomycetota bacterium]|nr:MAG: hypothetical protein DRP66_06120 [Planctomycetota bacterium]
METGGKDTARRLERLCDDYEVLMRRADFCSASAASEHARQCYCRKAISMYSRCLELDVADMTALLGLFEISHQAGDLEKIEYFLMRYLATYPHDVTIMLCLASVHLQAEQFDAARQILTDVLIIDADNMTAVDLIEELDHMEGQDSIEHIKETYLMQPVRGR